MDYIHNLGAAHHQLERVADYLNKQDRLIDYDLTEPPLNRAQRKSSVSAAGMLVTFAKNAVQFEHALLERVRVYKLTGK